jgi:hypothetical protein
VSTTCHDPARLVLPNLAKPPTHRRTVERGQALLSEQRQALALAMKHEPRLAVVGSS